MKLPFPRIIGWLRTTVFASKPEVPQSIFDTLRAYMHGSPLSQIDGFEAHTAAAPTISNGVAVVPVDGILAKNLSPLETQCGGCDIDQVIKNVDAAVTNPDVRAVLLHISSPGGSASGIPEAAAKLRELAKQKPIFSFADEQCCSAAYWLASSTNAVFTTSSAVLGSIGVYIALIDETEAFAKAGHKLELIKAGEFKATGIAGQPLSSAGRAMLQADVNNIYGMFVADVRAGRPGVADATCQGQCFRGQKAVDAKLADALVADLPAALRTVRTRIPAAAVALAPSAGSIPQTWAKISRGSGPSTKTEIQLPTPKNDADAWRIWRSLSGPTRTRFYCLHDQAIWRGKRAADRAAR